jgi:hypothetical protein
MLRSIPQDAFHLDPLANRVKKCDKDTISDDVKMFASKLSGVLNILGQVQDTGTVIGLRARDGQLLKLSLQGFVAG